MVDESSLSEPSRQKSLFSQLLTALISMNLISLKSILLEIFDLLIISTMMNISHDLIENHRCILSPFLVFLLPQPYQVPFLILIVYILIYSNMKPLYSPKNRATSPPQNQGEDVQKKESSLKIFK